MLNKDEMLLDAAEEIFHRMVTALTPIVMHLDRVPGFEGYEKGAIWQECLIKMTLTTLANCGLNKKEALEMLSDAIDDTYDGYTREAVRFAALSALLNKHLGSDQ